MSSINKFLNPNINFDILSITILINFHSIFGWSTNNVHDWIFLYKLNMWVVSFKQSENIDALVTVAVFLVIEHQLMCKLSNILYLLNYSFIILIFNIMISITK